MAGKYEKDFQKQVERYLIDNAHKLLEVEKEYYSPKNYQKIDVMSKFNGKVYYTEIKTYPEEQALQQGIGQLILYKFTHQYEENIIHQLAFPIYCLNNRTCITEQLEKFLDEKFNIKIIYVDWK
jgi:hypothetical protein